MSYPLGSMDTDQRAELYSEPRGHETRRLFRGVVATAVALVVMGLFGGGLWFAYNQGLRHANSGAAAEVPLIRADERPTKVKPEKPGGMEIPDRDKLIYTQKRASVEHLLPPPEKPMPRPTAPPAPAAQPEASQPASSAAAPPPSGVPALSVPAAPQQMVARTAPAPAPPAKSPAAQIVAASKSGARIQLGSMRDEDAARQEWARIKRSHADLLGGLSATPVRADLGDKGVYYRILTEPVADAERVCGELKRHNIGCIIAR